MPPSRRSVPDHHGWTYRRPYTDDLVEIGTVRGTDVALPAHFHEEDQITVVLSGRRRFLLRGAILSVEAGGCAVIPAGLPHRSLDEPAAVACLNLYLSPGLYAEPAMAREIERLLRQTARPEPADLMAIIGSHRLHGANPNPKRVISTGSVAQRAARIGLGREGFSRAFARAHGMPPHAFGLITRLNRARGLLRAGAPLAATAMEAGFADQSHLGRCFRRAFGVTPGQYRDGQVRDDQFPEEQSRSRTFQTRR